MCLTELSFEVTKECEEDAVTDRFLRKDIGTFLETKLTEYNLDSWNPRATTNHGWYLFDRNSLSDKSSNKLNVIAELEEGKAYGFQADYRATENEIETERYYVDLSHDYSGWVPNGVRIVQTLPESRTRYILQSSNYEREIDAFNWEATPEERSTFELIYVSPKQKLAALEVPKYQAEKVIFDAVKQSVQILSKGEKDPELSEQMLKDFQTIVSTVGGINCANSDN